MKLSNEFISRIQQFVPFDLTTSIGCTLMAHDISHTLNVVISPNTLKRAFGIIEASSSTSNFTLDLIARYIGYSSWECFLNDKSYDSSTFNNKKIILLSDFNIGQIIRFSYRPNRLVTIKCIAKNSFRVIQSINSKLIVNDIISASQIIERHPFHILNVNRNDNNLGTFTAGIHDGIESIEII